MPRNEGSAPPRPTSSPTGGAIRDNVTLKWRQTHYSTQGMQVFLIHGMGRSRVSMIPLSRHLRREGHAVSIFGYSVSRQSLDTIADNFLAHLEGGVSEQAGEPYAIVGHSLGTVSYTHLTLPTILLV